MPDELPQAIPGAERRWPRSLGIVGIALAAVQLSFHACATTVVSLESATPFWRQTYFTSTLVTFGLDILLLASAIGLLGRRRWSRAGFLTWAIVTLALQAVGYLRVAAGHAPGGLRQPGPADWVVGVVWFTAPPVFALIWFNRRSVRSEIARWK